MCLNSAKHRRPNLLNSRNGSIKHTKVRWGWAISYSTAQLIWQLRVLVLSPCHHRKAGANVVHLLRSYDLADPRLPPDPHLSELSVFRHFVVSLRSFCRATCPAGLQSGRPQDDVTKGCHKRHSLPFMYRSQLP